MKRRWLALLSGTISAALFVGFLMASPPADSPAVQGERVFVSNCSVCHATDGSANTPIGKNMKIPDLRSREIQAQTDKQLLDIVTNGKGKMMPFKERLKPAEIQQVVAYLRELPKHR
jgi:cytochrome c6